MPGTWAAARAATALTTKDASRAGTSSMTILSAPLLPDIGVLGLGYQVWGPHWMVQQHTLKRLARYFHVVWVDPSHDWREIPRKVSTRMRHARDDIADPGFHVYVPELWLPKLYRPAWLARLTFDQVVRRARRLLGRRGCQKVILSIWHPSFARALSSCSFDLTCYHIDDEFSFSEVEVALDEVERRLIATVDQVFIDSPGLMERKGAINPHTTFTANGVDYDSYATAVPPPADIASIPRPRVGYTGVLKKQLDWGLLLRLTQEHPNWSFVFVGPRSVHPEIMGPIEELARRRNVYFVGGKSAHELAAYPQHFDVCIMPYRANAYTQYIYPLKLHEYLASGRPVVGTEIRSLRDFSNVVSLVSTGEEWSAALEAALGTEANATERRAQRQAVAQRHDWRLLVREVACTMAERLGGDVRTRLESELHTAMAGREEMLP
jgi:glycosyltransferase involved in cell wall biosynthesis